MAQTWDDNWKKLQEEIQNSFNKVIAEVASDLVETKSCCESESLSVAYDLLSGELRFNCDPCDNDNPIEKTPKFLFVIAPHTSFLSREWNRQKDQREGEITSFLREAFPDQLLAIVMKSTKFVIAGTYNGMKAEVKRFFNKQAKRSNLPLVFFFGHGESETGKLCFHIGLPKADIATVLDDIKTAFIKCKTDDTPEHQCRVVFTQCHAHHVDDNDARGQIQINGIEYIYLTSSRCRKTTSREKSQQIVELQALAQDIVGDSPNNKKIVLSSPETPDKKNLRSRIKGYFLFVWESIQEFFYSYDVKKGSKAPASYSSKWYFKCKDQDSEWLVQSSSLE